MGRRPDGGGRYEQYVTNTEEKALHMSRMKEAVDKKRAHIEKSIVEGTRAAKKSGDDKKLGMVASRKSVPPRCLTLTLDPNPNP
jgi:ATP-binding cassette, subfamily F, member 3